MYTDPSELWSGLFVIHYQWRIQGAQGAMPPQTMDKSFSHLVIQITDRIFE